jgi:NAD(P)H-dependent FMN reductase
LPLAASRNLLISFAGLDVRRVNLREKYDHPYTEFVRKPIGFVGYGGVGAARAVERLRLVAIELQMAPVSRAVHTGMVESLGIMQQGKTFDDFPHLTQAANMLLDDMSWWAKTLKAAREGTTAGVAAREQRGKAVAVTE